MLDAGLFPPVIALQGLAAPLEVRKEAVWAVTNATSGGTREQIEALVDEHGCIGPLCTMLDPTLDDVMLAQVVEGLNNIVKLGPLSAEEGANRFSALVSEAGGQRKLRELRRGEIDMTSVVYQKVDQLLEWHFEEEEPEGQ